LTELLAVSSTEMGGTLGLLHSVLNISEDKSAPIKLLYLSFRDFLLSEQRCPNPQFRIDEKTAHKSLAESCLKAMSNTLRKDICGIRMPGLFSSEVERSKVDRCLSDCSVCLSLLS
jgi:hypothetical protein